MSDRGLSLSFELQADKSKGTSCSASSLCVGQRLRAVRIPGSGSFSFEGTGLL